MNMQASTELFRHPNLNSLEPESVPALIDARLAACRDAVCGIEEAWAHWQSQSLDTPEQTELAFRELIEPLTIADNELGLAFAPVRHLNAVMSSPQWREAHDNCLPKLSAWYTELGQNEKLYAVSKFLLENAAELDEARRSALKLQVREFELGGVALESSAKARYAEIAERLSMLSSSFSNHVLDATEAFSYLIETEAELAGIPESALAAARERAHAAGQTGWLFNLEYPSYHSIVTYADDRALRERFYRAFNTRASDQGPGSSNDDNSEVILEILALRAEKAQLLGYANYAELSVVPKMVDSPEQVTGFLQDLADRSVPQAREEFAELCAFAREHHGMDDVAAWDVPWLSDKLKQQRHALSDEDLKPWFPAPKVINGMFEVISRLFDVRIEALTEAELYHPDVTLYRISDAGGEPLGEFYLDPYARKGKRGGAWMDSAVGRMRTTELFQLPIAFLVANLTPPVGDQPALLTHNDVLTLFHEFGHGLHHMLTQVDVAEVAGIGGVEWDAVELPSQFLEYWCWERESLDLISSHHQTGEPLPDDLLRKMHAARNFQSAMQLSRQLEFSLFDMQIHTLSTPERPADVMAVLNQIRKQVAVIPYPQDNRFPHAFSHIFAGGYAAGYFSYKWAEVLSADAFSRFEVEGIMNPATGREFREQVLEKGATRPALESFVAFRGREPEVDALLRHSGLAA